LVVVEAGMAVTEQTLRHSATQPQAAVLVDIGEQYLQETVKMEEAGVPLVNTQV
jgi:hypothetical protein